MTLRAKVLTALIMLGLLLLATSVAFALYYRGNAIDYKAQRDTASSSLKRANETITDMQTRQRDVAALDAKYTKELASAKLKMMLCSASLIVVVGCSSQAAVRSRPPAPPAWTMEPPSNSLQLLDETFSVSEPESKKTGQR